MKSIRDTDGDVALGLHTCKTTKDILLTLKHLEGKSTELSNKKRGTIKELIVKRCDKTILEELTESAAALTITHTICVPKTRIEGDTLAHRLMSERQN